jgi:polysaccharide export outer membrane protein
MSRSPFAPLARCASLAALAFGLAAAPAAAQPGPSAAAPSAALGLQPTRAGLQAALSSLEAAGATGAGEAELIRARLRDGDFQVGDQLGVTVEGEQALTATFTVGAGRVLVLPGLGEVSLAGVLRSEAEAKLTADLRRYLREPVVHVHPLVRLAVIGQVRQPGYYVLAADALVSDAIMAAGGPLPTAKLAAARIERGPQRIWEGRALQQAIAQGRTLDQMSLRAGDQVSVPNDSGSRGAAAMRAALAVPGAILALVAGIKVM